MLIYELPFSLSFCALCWWDSSSCLWFNSVKIVTALSFISSIWLLSVSAYLAWDENLTGFYCLAFWYSEHMDYRNTILRCMYMHVHMYFLSYLKIYLWQPSPNLTGISVSNPIYSTFIWFHIFLPHMYRLYLFSHCSFSAFFFILFFFFWNLQSWICAGIGEPMGFLIYSKAATQ